VVDAATARPHVGEGRITERVAGEALGPRIVRAERSDAERRALAAQMGRALAAVHSIDPAGVPGLTRRDPLEATRAGLDLMGEARPAVELALRWLAANRPEPGPARIVHGDFRVGNLLIDETGLRSVLDWELAHLGDPLEDLGWLCARAWRFGGDHEVGGVADLDDLLAAYAEARGAPVAAADVRWWTAAGTLTWALICAVQAHRHLDGHVRSVELATIGRRICESEYDLLRLMEGDHPPTTPAPSPLSPTSPTGARSGPSDGAHASQVPDGGDPGGEDPGGPPDLHGRPTAAELVDAVRSHLADDVGPALTGAAAFQARVAGTALGIVERELRLGPALAAAHAERLAALGFGSEAALAAAIRAGELDDRPDVVAAVRAAVVARLRVANPGWLQGPDRGDAPGGAS